MDEEKSCVWISVRESRYSRRSSPPPHPLPAPPTRSPLPASRPQPNQHSTEANIHALQLSPWSSESLHPPIRNWILPGSTSSAWKWTHQAKLPETAALTSTRMPACEKASLVFQLNCTWALGLFPHQDREMMYEPPQLRHLGCIDLQS